MPKIRRRNVPAPLFQHLLERIHERRIGSEQIESLARWLDAEPEVPEGPWFKRFSGMTVCGEGEMVKTFLLPSQSPKGRPVA